MSTQALSKEVSIQDLVSDLRKFPASAFDQTPEILRFLTNTPVAPLTLTPYLCWDGQHYTRNLIDKTSLYELIAICWDIGQGSSIHNHREQNCWMAVPIGRLLVENYHLVTQDIDLGTCELEISGTVEMDPAHPCAVDPADPVDDPLDGQIEIGRQVRADLFEEVVHVVALAAPWSRHVRSV